MKEKAVYRCKRCGDVFYCPTGFVDEVIFKFRQLFKLLSCPRCGSTLIDEEQYIEEKKKKVSATKKSSSCTSFEVAFTCRRQQVGSRLNQHMMAFMPWLRIERTWA